MGGRRLEVWHRVVVVEALVEVHVSVNRFAARWWTARCIAVVCRMVVGRRDAIDRRCVRTEFGLSGWMGTAERRLLIVVGGQQLIGMDVRCEIGATRCAAAGGRLGRGER